MRTTWAVLWFVLAGNIAVPADTPPVGVPRKADPPFAIDGDLADWANLPTPPLLINQAAQCIHGAAAWRDPRDLSARVQLAWREDGLYLGVDVTDDQLRQSQRGDGIWRGDHVELYLDAQPDLEPRRTTLGAGQFHLAFSPGNLRPGADTLPPEAFCYRPAGTVLAGVRVAARRTDQGYTIEALVPWSDLGLTGAREGQTLRFEIGVSDTDSDEPKQEKMMTLGTAPWRHARDRLRDAVLAGVDGVPRPLARAVAIADGARVTPGGTQTLRFDAPAVPAGRDGVLAFQARLEFARVAGHARALRLRLNGQPVGGDRAIGRPQRAPARGGDIYGLWSADTFQVFYAPDFVRADQDPHYGLLDGVKACHFELRVSDLLRPGANQLTIEHADPHLKTDLVVGAVRLEFQVPPPPPRPKAGPPTGPLPVCEPTPVAPVPYQVEELPEGRLAVSLAGERYAIESRFSTPEPGWTSGGGRWFDYQRTIERRPECIVVRERFTNRTDGDLGLMQRHSLAVAPGAPVWVSGLRRPAGVATSAQPENPTVYAGARSGGVGLVALDDVFRNHVVAFAGDGRVGLRDDHRVLPAGGSAVSEWAVFPTGAPDYWPFINAVRRFVGANFLIDGGFAFLRADAWLNDRWTDEQVRRFIVNKDARYVCATIPSTAGHAAHGVVFQGLDLSIYRKQFERRLRLVPGIRNLIYFHCFLDTSADGVERFRDSRLLRADGRHGDYGQAVYKLYLPLANNSYGPAIAKNIDAILDGARAAGVYWDEHEYSAYRYHYGEPWDQVSGDLDPQTYQVARRKSSVTLLTEAWRLAQAKRILARGPLIGNGAPTTRAMADLHFPCFVETGSITHCVLNHLTSPIALGDHLTERGEEDAYRLMLAALEHGCLYHWYNDVTVVPSHPHLTRYMYPIEPVELRSGTILGRDRIITRRSGLYGFGDASGLSVHVFNDRGVEVPNHPVPVVRREGRNLVELRLAEDWSAAILKGP